MYPFLLQLRLVLTANAQGSLFYTVPNTESLNIKAIIQSSTGVWQILDVRDTTGRHYTNAGSSNPIPSAVIASGSNNNNSIKDLGAPIELAGGVGLIIDAQDTSGAGNTINVTLICERGDA